MGRLRDAAVRFFKALEASPICAEDCGCEDCEISCDYCDNGWACDCGGAQ